MTSVLMKRRKVYFKRIRKIKYFILCKVLFAALPTVVFGVFTVIFTLQQNISAKATREQDQRQADEINRRVIFKEYIDDMTALLLNRDNDSDFSKILLHMRVQTLTALQNLDVNRKRDIIVFLYENRLLRSDVSPQVDLHGANLNGIRFWSSSSVACLLPFLYLPGVYAENITFDRCTLNEAVFDDASMSSAKFVACTMLSVRFVKTNLTRAQFQGSVMYNTDFIDSYLTQSSITGGLFRDMKLINTDLYQSDISDELLHPSKNTGLGSNSFSNSRHPNGSFVDMNRQRLIVYDQCKSLDNTLSSSPSIATDVRQISEMEESATTGDCLVLTDNNMGDMRDIDVQQFSLLIDLEQAALDLSWFIRWNQSNDDQFSMVVQFIQSDDLSNEEESLTILKKASSLSQFNSFRNSIPTKTRLLRITLMCKMTTYIDQFCSLEYVKLFVLEKRLLDLNSNRSISPQRR